MDRAVALVEQRAAPRQQQVRWTHVWPLRVGVTPDEIARSRAGAVPPETTLEENYNVAPTGRGVRRPCRPRSPIGRVRSAGAVPPWADDLKIGSR
ncbi:MAG: hypothetical protein R2710_17815 [Acidimicrobiales bacterium]